jgi:hypothetical protein
MLDRLMGDAQFVEAGEQIVRAGGHRRLGWFGFAFDSP